MNAKVAVTQESTENYVYMRNPPGEYIYIGKNFYKTAQWIFGKKDTIYLNPVQCRDLRLFEDDTVPVEYFTAGAFPPIPEVCVELSPTWNQHGLLSANAATKALRAALAECPLSTGQTLMVKVGDLVYKGKVLHKCFGRVTPDTQFEIKGSNLTIIRDMVTEWTDLLADDIHSDLKTLEIFLLECKDRFAIKKAVEFALGRFDENAPLKNMFCADCFMDQSGNTVDKIISSARVLIKLRNILVFL